MAKKKQTKRHKPKGDGRIAPAGTSLDKVCCKRGCHRYRVAGAEVCPRHLPRLEPAVGKVRDRLAPGAKDTPPPAPRLKVPKYLTSESGLPALQMAQWAIIDARSMDKTSIGRVHLPMSMKLIDGSISELMASKDERSKRAGCSLLRLMQDGEDNRFKVEMQLRETALEAYQAGVSADLQAEIDQQGAEGVSVDVLGQVEPLIREAVKNALEQALKSNK